MNKNLCLPCARLKLAKRPTTKCHECRRLSADPLAKVRAKSARAASTVMIGLGK